jgi:hypothetical protein
MLNESLNMEQAGPFRKLLERQVTEQGGVFQGITATPEGDLMPVGTKPDGTRVYGSAIPVEQGYSQQYLAAKQAKELETRKAMADVEATEALRDQRLAAANKNTMGDQVRGGQNPSEVRTGYNRYMNAYQKTENILGGIAEAVNKVDGTTAGLYGQVASGIGGTDARDLQASLETIQANLGFEELQAMRDASKTGGALGQVTERELKFLQSVKASLDQAQSPEQLRQQLIRAGQQIKTSWERINAAYREENGLAMPQTKDKAQAANAGNDPLGIR